MPTTTVCPDDDQFVNNQNEVNSELVRVAEELEPNAVLVCVSCGELLSAERKRALPSAIRCLSCQAQLEREQAEA